MEQMQEHAQERFSCCRSVQLRARVSPGQELLGHPGNSTVVQHPDVHPETPRVVRNLHISTSRPAFLRLLLSPQPPFS